MGFGKCYTDVQMFHDHRIVYSIYEHPPATDVQRDAPTRCAPLITAQTSVEENVTRNAMKTITRIERWRPQSTDTRSITRASATPIEKTERATEVATVRLQLGQSSIVIVYCDRMMGRQTTGKQSESVVVWMGKSRTHVFIQGTRQTGQSCIKSAFNDGHVHLDAYRI